MVDQADSLREIVKTRNSEFKKQVAAQGRYSDGVMVAPRVIAVTSGKGGVGKTNIVGNLAMASSMTFALSAGTPGGPTTPLTTGSEGIS